MHFCCMIQSDCRILCIESLDILRSKLSFWICIDEDIRTFFLFCKALENSQINIVVNKNDLFLCGLDKAFKLCVGVKNLSLKENALGIVYIVFIHEGKKLIYALV